MPRSAGKLARMMRSGASGVIRVVVLLLGASLPVTALVAVRLLPPADLTAAGLGWLTPALAVALVVASSTLAIACLVGGLRSGAVAALLGAAAGASIAGGALALALGGTLHALVAPMALAGPVTAAVVVADRTASVLPGRGQRVALAAGGLLLAEAVALVGSLPATAPVIAGWDGPLLLAAVVAAGVAAALAALGPGGGWLVAAAAAAGIGAAGALVDRGAGLELALGLLGLIAAALAGLGAVTTRPGTEVAEGRSPALPALAHQLADAVLQFDGRLGLRDWNGSAAALLGLDARSHGSRLEDLLGVQIAELPGEQDRSVSTTAVGGLEIRLHRSGDGVVAVVAADAGRGDEDRLGRELRGTIEELLQARRTIELQRAEIERSSTIDLLTGVASRGAILDRLRTEIAEARRYQHPVAVLLLDVDDLADVNHRHGVSGGDALLREVALRMRLRVREADALGRAGSDGFLAILPHTDEAGATTFAAALRHRLSQRPVPVGDELVPLSVSIGVAVMRAGEALELDGLLERVGEALDSARTAGGDRIALDREHGFLRLAPGDEDQAGGRDREAN